MGIMAVAATVDEAAGTDVISDTIVGHMEPATITVLIVEILLKDIK